MSRRFVATSQAVVVALGAGSVSGLLPHHPASSELVSVAHSAGSSAKQTVLPGVQAQLVAAGTQVPLSAAVAEAPFPVYRPQTDLASDASISQVWVRTTWDPEVYIRYNSGIDVSVRRASFLGNRTPDEFYNQEMLRGVLVRSSRSTASTSWSCRGTIRASRRARRWS